MDKKLQEKIDQGYILCRVIIEVAGTPKSHIEKTIKMVVENIKNQDNEIILKSGDVFKTKEIEMKEVTKGKLFSTYAELELLFKNITKMIGFCFDYMPSSMEILEPEDLKLETKDFAGLINDLLAKLHQVDMTLKGLRAENKILNDNASNLLRNLILLGVGKKEKTLKEISKIVGIPEKQLEPFIKVMVEKGKVKLKDGVYSLSK